ncbi:acyl-CoA thioester hydrolase [Alteribacillus persepolensis]|uniref:Acyl-CoA thioester hydrolase n=1 Tax=Alteribacillus persepolensis TaxID=568899 RepID=A0A1G8B0U5_9BACI|nr:thioesterase family protein [Alteribacillus persepolensis]SDH26754.1 acyl-CoA thioester hydrolase [Alteribacillus persepolensis]
MHDLLSNVVVAEQVDYNQHMNDAAYYKVFSEAGFSFTDDLGMGQRERDEYGTTIFTLETHVVYVKEIREGEHFTVHGRILDYDKKRIHLFMEMRNDQHEKLATAETMLMAINQKERKAGHFPDVVYENIQSFAEETREQTWPKEAGRRIGIRQRKGT